jgi:hypothetical protein
MKKAGIPAVALTALMLGLGVAAPANLAHAASGSDYGYTESDIEAFAQAASEVQNINVTYDPLFAEAQTKEEQDAIWNEATAMMVAAIQEAGLTIDQFNEIATTAQSDPEFAQEIEEHRSGLQ